MPDTHVHVVGRSEPIIYPNTTYIAHPDGDLEIQRGRTNLETVAIHHRGQWQYVDSQRGAR